MFYYFTAPTMTVQVVRDHTSRKRAKNRHDIGHAVLGNTTQVPDIRRETAVQVILHPIQPESRSVPRQEIQNTKSLVQL